MLTDRKYKRLDNAINGIKSHTNIYNKVICIAADINTNEEVLELAKHVKENTGCTHIVSICAGARGAAGDFLQPTDYDWQNRIVVDIKGVVRVARAFF